MTAMNQVPAPAAQRPDFGVRLTQADYERRIASLYKSYPPMPTDEQEIERSYSELQILVDYRLGMDFPVDRRRQLWQAKRRLDKHFLLVLLWGFLTRPWDPATGLMGVYGRAFAGVLKPDEVRVFFDVNEEDSKLLRLHRS